MLPKLCRILTTAESVYDFMHEPVWNIPDAEGQETDDGLEVFRTSHQDAPVVEAQVAELATRAQPLFFHNFSGLSDRLFAPIPYVDQPTICADRQAETGRGSPPSLRHRHLGLDKGSFGAGCKAEFKRQREAERAMFLETQDGSVEKRPPEMI